MSLAQYKNYRRVQGYLSGVLKANFQGLPPAAEFTIEDIGTHYLCRHPKVKNPLAVDKQKMRERGLKI